MVRKHAKLMLPITLFGVFCASRISKQVAKKGRSGFMKDFTVLWLLQAGANLVTTVSSFVHENNIGNSKHNDDCRPS